MSVQLGVGLIRIGREWGHVAQPVPSEAEALAFLEHAFAVGIRYFDTAPSYSLSEERFGRFLRGLGADVRRDLTIATKFGEHWNRDAGQPYVDHSYDALRRSLDRSLERLGHVDVLQLHKTMPDVLRSAELARAWDYARSLGIAMLGASVSDLDSAALAIADAQYRCIQLPLNKTNTRFESAVDEAARRGMFVAVNRPYAMGAMAPGPDAFRYLLERRFDGVILTGTAKPQHLDQNLQAFRQAFEMCDAPPPVGSR
jgi:aryl-alcohol dehydrogenase-like predicted oxidoreductase